MTTTRDRGQHLAEPGRQAAAIDHIAQPPAPPASNRCPGHSNRAECEQLENPIAYTLVSVAVILAVFIPLSVRQYKKAAARQ